MALISLHQLYLRFGDEYLFSNISLHIEQGDRLCLLGRNGAGKSTLLKVMAGRVQPDEGSAARSRDTHIAYLDQNFAEDVPGSALDFCLSEDANISDARNSSTAVDSSLAVKFLHQLGIDSDAQFNQLSGGGRRRVMLAKVLASEPDVLLLDEPTNHLDIESISWLEDYLKRGSVRTLVLITHDRQFARSVSNRIAELDRGELFAFDCGYSDFLARREEILSAEDSARALFDKRLKEEEAWLRRGIKARRTRNEGRVKALMNMREEFKNRRQRQGSVHMTLNSGERSGDLVFECEHLSFSYVQQQPALIHDFSTIIMRGDRIGIAGPNGSGKTTLVKLLLGELNAQEGMLRRGTNLRSIYFSQMRDSLDPEKSIIENLSGGDDSVMIGGKLKHVNAYLQDFLFSPDRIRTPVGILSGGERNRLLLAKLFTQSANLLVLDEPTNDLDMETLDLLEDLLMDYDGTVLLISHDREFLDNVVTHLLVFTEGGQIEEYVGSYSQWREKRAKTEGQAKSTTQKPTVSGAPSGNRQRSEKPRKLTFKETRELEALPEAIGELEHKVSAIHEQLADPELYKKDASRAGVLTAELDQTEQELAQKYERWAELEDIASQ